MFDMIGHDVLHAMLLAHALHVAGGVLQPDSIKAVARKAGTVQAKNYMQTTTLPCRQTPDWIGERLT